MRAKVQFKDRGEKMSTVAQIFDYAKWKYPKANNATIFPETNMLQDLDYVHKEEYIKFQRLKGQYETETIPTVAGQEEYDLPASCFVENIESLKVIETQEQYEYAGAKTDTRFGLWFSHGSTTAKVKIIQNGYPINTTGYNIEIKYYPTPSPITATTQTPELDEIAHSLLTYRLINRLASTGENPDIDVANAWQDEYDTQAPYIIKKFRMNFNKKSQTFNWW